MTTPNPDPIEPGPVPETKPATGPESDSVAPPDPGFPWPIAGAILIALLIFARPLLRAVLPAPQLAPALRLMNEGRFEEAERKLSDFLAYEPSNVRARLAMALSQLNREDPKPAEALKSVEAIHPDSAIDAADAQVVRGRALEALKRLGESEAAYEQAIRIYPLVGEAGWHLLDLYYIEGREDESRSLALSLSRNEPNPGDRARLLLEPIRFEAEPLASAGIIPKLADAVASDPNDVHAGLAYYRAQADDGTGIEEAVKGLRGLVERHPENLACRVGLLYALSSTGDLDSLERALQDVPPELAEAPKIAGYRGRLALDRRDYPAAIASLEPATRAYPSNPKWLHMLGDAYRFAGRADEAEAIKAREAVLEIGRIELRGIKGKEQEVGQPGLFEEALTRRDLGFVPSPELYKRLAANRERMGHPGEALAWYEAILRDDPQEAEALAAVNRLRPEAK